MVEDRAEVPVPVTSGPSAANAGALQPEAEPERPLSEDAPDPDGGLEPATHIEELPRDPALDVQPPPPLLEERVEVREPVAPEGGGAAVAPPSPVEEPAPGEPVVLLAAAVPLPSPVLDTSSGPAIPLPPGEVANAWSYHLFRALRFGVAIALVLAGFVLLLVVLYRWVDPPASMLMLGQRLTGTPIVQRWVPIERMSPNLVHAVVISEDASFCRHRGVDWGELVEAIDRSRDGVPRGGSTISMQVAKNLFLWPSRSYVRKAIEIPLTYVIEASWSKRRILEVYLNIAEWGPGVFGAEAAARYHFRKPATLLTPREAALLAVALPNPFERQAGSPGPGTSRLAQSLMMRMGAGPARASCLGLRSGRTPG